MENNCKNGEINYKKLKVLRSCSPDYFWLEGEPKLTISARVEPYSGVRGNQVPYYDYHYHCNCYFYRYHQHVTCNVSKPFHNYCHFCSNLDAEAAKGMLDQFVRF